jgi:hypothetical protein
MQVKWYMGTGPLSVLFVTALMVCVSFQTLLAGRYDVPTSYERLVASRMRTGIELMVGSGSACCDRQLSARQVASRCLALRGNCLALSSDADSTPAQLNTHSTTRISTLGKVAVCAAEFGAATLGTGAAYALSGCTSWDGYPTTLTYPVFAVSSALLTSLPVHIVGAATHDKHTFLHALLGGFVGGAVGSATAYEFMQGRLQKSGSLVLVGLFVLPQLCATVAYNIW